MCLTHVQVHVCVCVCVIYCVFSNVCQPALLPTEQWLQFNVEAICLPWDSERGRGLVRVLCADSSKYQPRQSSLFRAGFFLCCLLKTHRERFPYSIHDIHQTGRRTDQSFAVVWGAILLNWEDGFSVIHIQLVVFLTEHQDICERQLYQYTNWYINVEMWKGREIHFSLQRVELIMSRNKPLSRRRGQELTIKQIQKIKELCPCGHWTSIRAITELHSTFLWDVFYSFINILFKFVV